MTMKCLSGFHDEAFIALAERMKYMSKRDKVCCLTIDEVSLKRNLQYDRYNDLIVGYEDMGTNESRCNKPATSALVFMLRGLSTNWNQPSGYVFTSSACKVTHVQNLIQNCLNKCEQFGIDVKVILSDHGPNFQQLANILGITTVKPYFTFNNKNYFYMFDPPHLLKSIIINLFKYDFHFGKCKIVKWKFIDDYFKIDQQRRFRLCPKLTLDHITLTPFSKMKVQLATHIFSKSLAAGLESSEKLLGRDAISTPEFLSRFDDIFDCAKSSVLHVPKPWQCALSDTSCHLQFLDDNIKWISDLKIMNGEKSCN